MCSFITAKRKVTRKSNINASNAMMLLGVTNADLYDAAGLAKQRCLATHSSEI